MECTVVTRPEMKLVGIKVVGRLQEFSHRVPLAWNDLMGALGRISHIASSELFYGVYPESDHHTDGVNGVHTYWVCVEVSELGDVPEGFTTLTIPGGDFAMTTVRGQASEIISAYQRLTGWAKLQGMELDQQDYGFELYDVRRQKPTPPYSEFDFDIYKPLV